MIPEEKQDLPVVVAEPIRVPYPPAPNFAAPVFDAEADEPTVPLSHYLWILRRHRWKILAFVGACVASTLIVSFRLTPIYESTATIDIDRRMPTGILGEEAMQSSTNDADEFIATQIKLIQSDSVLRPVAQKYKLRELENKDWDKDTVKQADAEDTPVILKKLKVTRPPNTYLMLVSYRSKDKRLAADVANGIAQSYLEHTYNIRYRAAAGLSGFMEKQQEELRAKMERSSAALAQFERELNIISPEEKTNILSARLLQLNEEYTKAQADRVKKEAAYTSMQSGATEAAHVSSQGEALRKLTESLNEAQQKFAEIKTRYGANHPEYKRIAAQVEETQEELRKTKDSIAQRVEIEYKEAADREGMLQKAVRETKAEFDRLNARSFEYQTLKREAEADKKLYEELVRKIKEASINASFQNSSIRIADLGRPGLKPVMPIIELNTLIAFLLSGLFAVAAAFIADTLDNTVRDPEQVAKSLKTQVVGSLPQVKTWRTQLATVTANGVSSGDGDGLAPLGEAAHRSLTTYEEAIRTLRNSILLTNFDNQFRTLLVTSASPSEGKSTIAIHLAVAHAQQRHRTLVIDGDLRRPSIHKRFGITNTVGLSNVLMKELSWRRALLKPEGIADLDILTAGSVSRRAADLIGKGLQPLLDEAAREYELIILDAPPLLGFPEPLQMATAADGVIIVARAGQTSRKGVASVLSTLTRLRANVIGLVLNEVHREISDTYYYYGYYGKYHKHYNGASCNSKSQTL
jgi:capsular exopolysaccharide synthesis family protein